MCEEGGRSAESEAGFQSEVSGGALSGAEAEGSSIRYGHRVHCEILNTHICEGS